MRTNAESTNAAWLRNHFIIARHGTKYSTPDSDPSYSTSDHQVPDSASGSTVMVAGGKIVPPNRDLTRSASIFFGAGSPIFAAMKNSRNGSPDSDTIPTSTSFMISLASLANRRHKSNSSGSTA